MAILTGEALLEAVLSETGANISELFQEVLEIRLQNVIDVGLTSNLALGAILGANAQIVSALPAGENPVDAIMNVVRAAKTIIENSPSSSLTTVDIDTGTITPPDIFEAGDGAYNFTDDAAVANNVEINNFSSDDIITFVNAETSDYEIKNRGADVVISYKYDEETMNIVQLNGVVSSDDMVYDQASFASAAGFDAFAG